MSLSNKKILVSGCGFSWGGQERKTWVRILQLCGADVVDVGGPAVSNQWIIDRAFDTILREKIDTVIIQLTSLKKLDVEITPERQSLVDNDTVRNFTIDNVWPSSVSQCHESKQLYYRWLYSPQLETQELFTKIMLFDNWCHGHNIELKIYQAYSIAWTPWQAQQLKSRIINLNDPLYDKYLSSSHYHSHDHSNSNTVPCLSYQVELAQIIAQQTVPDCVGNINQIQQYLSAK